MTWRGLPGHLALKTLVQLLRLWFVRHEQPRCAATRALRAQHRILPVPPVFSHSVSASHMT